MSRSLHINLVKTKTVGSNKCLVLMNYIQELGSPAILSESDIPALNAIRMSIGKENDATEDIEDVVTLLQKHGQLEFEIVW